MENVLARRSGVRTANAASVLILLKCEWMRTWRLSTMCRSTWDLNCDYYYCDEKQIHHHHLFSKKLVFKTPKFDRPEDSETYCKTGFLSCRVECVCWWWWLCSFLFLFLVFVEMMMKWTWIQKILDLCPWDHTHFLLVGVMIYTSCMCVYGKCSKITKK